MCKCLSSQTNDKLLLQKAEWMWKEGIKQSIFEAKCDFVTKLKPDGNKMSFLLKPEHL